MTLADRLTEDMKRAMKARDAVRLSVIRLARAAIRNAEIEKGRTLTDAEIVDVLHHEVKRRREAIEGFARGKRDDLVEREQLELAILSDYLPPPLEDDALCQVIAEAITQVGARSQRDLGRVMAAVMPKVRGRAEGKRVDRLTREMLPRE